MSALSIRAVSKAYGTVEVLRDLSLEIESGEFAAVLGVSGCGKSTLLRLLAGFDAVDGGEIEIASALVDDGARQVPPNHRRVGYVPQEGALFPHLDVRANVAFGLPRAQRSGPRVGELLELVGLTGMERRGAASSPAASSSASRSPARSRRHPTSCCSTSRSRRSIPSCARACAPRCARRSRGSARRPCSSRTTRRRRCPAPTASRSCATARSRRSAAHASCTSRPATSSSRASSARRTCCPPASRTGARRRSSASCTCARRRPARRAVRGSSSCARRSCGSPSPTARAHATRSSPPSFYGHDARVELVCEHPAGEFTLVARTTGIDAPEVGQRVVCSPGSTAHAL